jgi:hypothetical protein
MFSPDYSKRGYLLPDGCKDLIDVLRLNESQVAWRVGQPLSPTPPPKGDILLSQKATVREFAAILGQKPFKVIADAMELGVFANANMYLDFETMSKIARKYGYTARKAI